MNRIIIIVVAGILAAVALTFNQDSDSPYARADRYLRNKQDAKAAKEIEIAIEKDKNKVLAVFNGAAVYSAHHRFISADRLMNRLLDDPKKLIGRDLKNYEEIAILHDLSVIRSEREDHKGSVVLMERAVKLAPHSPELMNGLAYLYAEADTKLPEALKLAKQAHKALPNQGYVTDTLGWVHHKLGNKQDAIYYLRKAVQQSRDEASLRYHLGAAYAANGDRAKAWIELKKALTLDSSMTEARKVLQNLNYSG